MTSGPDKAMLIERANARRWFHRIQLFDDYETPGIDATPEKLRHLASLGLPDDLTGQRVLDIGAWDGFFSFEMERRGAEVVALDHVAKSATGFEIAALALNSNVTWKKQNLYHLDPTQIGTFDIVLCLGVIYHLRHIVLGLDRVRSVLRDNGKLFVETAAIDKHLLLPGGRVGELTSACPEAAETPLLQFYPHKELGNDPTNFFAPNLAGLTALLEATEFEVLETLSAPDGAHSRAYAHARAITNSDVAFYRERDEAILERRSYTKA